VSSKKRLIIQTALSASAAVFLVMGVTPGRAAASVSGVLACRSVADDAARLACFDRESAQIESTSAATSAQAPTAPQSAGVPASPAASPTQPPPAAVAKAPDSATRPAFAANTAVASAAELDPQKTFGLSSAELSAREVAAGARPREVTSITAHIARFTLGGNGRAIFVLDDGQIWQQLLSEGDLNAKPGDTVQISRGAFSSYWLKEQQSGRGCKVTRLR
jgi:hypothetical protein